MSLLTRVFLKVVCLALVALFCRAGLVKAEGERVGSVNLATKLLGDRLGDFVARGSATQVTSSPVGELPLTAFSITDRAGRDYFSRDGGRFSVDIATTSSESAAYSLLTYLTKNAAASHQLTPVSVGTAGVAAGATVYLFRGPNCAIVSARVTSSANLDQALALAGALAMSLDKGEAEIPVLVKHLPDWQNVSPLYAVSLATLEKVVSNQPILNDLTFEGGTEAVAANYGQSQLVIVEFTTPQFSVDNDQRITARIQELKAQGQPVPTAYRRVGNYSVFVFNALDEKSANQLIDQVKYEQVVQWLGDDPHLYERLQRYLAQTSAGVLIAVLKSSGLSLILCLGIGASIGILLFRHRRAQKAAAYSDAGGSVRLNLDELTSTINSDRLLGSGTASKSDPNRS